jgi:hypothetical protein
VNTLTIAINCTFDAFGMSFDMDPMSHRNIVVDVAPFSSDSQMEWITQLQLHTIIQTNSQPVFMVRKMQQELASTDVAIQESLLLAVTPYCSDPMDQNASLPQVALDQLRGVHHTINDCDLVDPLLLVTMKNSKNVDDGQ